MKNKFIFAGYLLFAIFLFLPTYVFAGTATLNWNANTEPDLASYKVYYGTVSRTGTLPCANAGYASNIPVGNVTTYNFSNLTDGATYYFAVSAYDSTGNESACSTQQSKVIPVIDTATPSIPTNLVTTVISSSQINLSWSASTDNVGVTGYKIYRNGSQVSNVIGQVSYQDTGLTASTAYSYTVSAYDAAGNNSSQSSSISATTQSASIPPTSNLLLNPDFEGGFTSNLANNWNITTDGSVSYSIAQDTGYQGSAQKINISSPGSWGLYYYQTPSFQLNQYYNWSFWYKTQGTGSLEAHITNAPHTQVVHSESLPSTNGQWTYKTINFQYTNSLANQLRFSSNIISSYWIDNIQLAVAPPSIQNFSPNQIIEAESGQLTSMQTGTSGSDTYIYTNTNDIGSAKYTFNISTAGQYKLEDRVNSNNNGGQNSFFVGLDNELAQGNILYAYHISPLSTGFVWDEVSKWGNGTTLPQFDPMTWNLTQGTHSFTFYGRESNTWLDQIKLVSVDTTPSDTASPSIPASITATPYSSSQINLSWSASTDNVGVTGYKIYRNGSQVSNVIGQVSYQDTGLTASTAYSYTVSAYDAAGNNSTQSTSVSATTQAPPDTTPPAISNISSISNTNSATISFTLSETATSYIEHGLTTSYGVTTSTTTASSIIISNLNPNTTYNFRITSKDLSNNQTISQNYTFITQQVADTTPPSTIINLAISNIGQTSLALTWAAPSDVSGVSSYDIRYSTSPISEANFSQATQASSIPTPTQEGLAQQIYISVGLTPNTTYHFVIKSIDSVGNVSNISNTPQATTLSAPSTTSPNPSTNPGTVSVPVTPSTGTGGGGGGYTVYQASDTISPNPPSNTIITSMANQITISWANPTDSDFVRVKILRSNTNYPSSPIDGTLIFEGTKTTITDTKLQNDQAYYYAIYSYDSVPNYSTPIKLTATPKASVTQISTIQQPTQQPIVPTPSKPSIKEGSLIRGPDKIKVYIVNGFGFKRHIFNPAIFNMYGHFKWDEIRDIDQQTLDSYKTSDFYRADTDQRVFSLKEMDERQGKAEKRWLNIKGERFTTLGYKWEQVFIINDKERDYYQEGTPIGETELQEKAIQTIKTIQPYSLVKTENSPTIYFITKQGIKKPILNEQVFNSYPQNNWNNIITATEETLKQYPTATTIKLQGDERIYTIDFQSKTKRWVRTLDAFNTLGLSWDEVVEVNQTELGMYAEVSGN